MFSIINNPVETVRYLGEVRARLQRSNVHAVLRNVKDVTPDALLALITYADADRCLGQLMGDVPADAAARVVVQTCGFQELVRGLSKPGHKPMGFVETATTYARRGHDADAELAFRLVGKACGLVGMPYHRVSYSNLIECMTNTNNHAACSQGGIAWRLMVTRASAGLVRFIFMDPGRGICRTARTRVPNLDDPSLLKAMLRTDRNGFRDLLAAIPAGLPTGSRTDEPGRGRGLRKIAQSMDRGGLARLVVVANGAYVDLSANRMVRLPKPGFYGTLIYWEIESTGSEVFA